MFSEKASLSPAPSKSVPEGFDTTSQIEWIDGTLGGLIIAPHGVMGNDDNTGPLARQTARHAGFYAGINEIFRRPPHPAQADAKKNLADLNRIDQVQTHLHDLFLQPLLKRKEDLIQKHGQLIIALIHGINDRNLGTYIRETASPEDTAMLVGFGQGNDKGSLSAQPALADYLIQLLKTNPIEGITARSTAVSYRNYRGGHRNNLNQLFRQTKYRDDRVQSLQLEITWTGYRDTPPNIRKTALALGWALRRLAETNLRQGKLETFT